MVRVEAVPETPDDVRLADLDMPHNLRAALLGAGFVTVGEIRETQDERLHEIAGLSAGSVEWLRRALGLPSSEGVRPPPIAGSG